MMQVCNEEGEREREREREEGKELTFPPLLVSPRFESFP